MFFVALKAKFLFDFRNKIFARIHGGVTHQTNNKINHNVGHHNHQPEWKQMSNVVNAKKNLNDEIKQLSQRLHASNPPLTDDERRLQTIRDQRRRWENMRQTREQYVQSSLERKEVRFAVVIHVVTNAVTNAFFVPGNQTSATTASLQKYVPKISFRRKT